MMLKTYVHYYYVKLYFLLFLFNSVRIMLFFLFFLFFSDSYV